MRKVTFVCTGNTCRSVMAEYLFKRMLKDAEIDDIEVGSAGTAAMPHYSIFGELAEVFEENGLEYTDHTPTMINRKILKESDLLLVMTKNHKKYINKWFPGYEEKVYLLTEFSGAGKDDVKDPIGQGIEAYREAYEEIKENLEKIIEKLTDEKQ